MKEKTAFFFKRKTEKKKAIAQGRLEGLSRFLRYFFIQLKIKIPYKKILQNPQGLTFTVLEADLPLLCFFWFSSLRGGGRGLSVDKTNHQGQEKSKPGIGFCVMTCFFTALDTALMADRRLFTVLFYLKKSNNSKQKRDVPAVCDGVGRCVQAWGYLAKPEVHNASYMTAEKTLKYR